MTQASVHQSGFTLLELIVASGIFAMVTLVGFAVMSDSAQVQALTESQRLVGQTARFSLEAIAREARLANGYATLDPSLGEYVTEAPPFQILDSVLEQDLAVGEALRLTTTDFVDPFTPIQRVKELRVREHPATGHRYIELASCGNQSCTSITSSDNLTPDSVEVESIQFRGLPTSATGRKPFLEITLTVTTGEKDAEKARQTVRTVVTPRNYTEELS